jgi:hypothetical protein
LGMTMGPFFEWNGEVIVEPLAGLVQPAPYTDSHS